MENNRENVLKRVLKKIIGKMIGWYVYPLVSDANKRCELVHTQNNEALESLRIQYNDLFKKIVLENEENYNKVFSMLEKSKKDYEEANGLFQSLLVKKESIWNIPIIDVMKDSEIRKPLMEIKDSGHMASIEKGLFDKLGTIFQEDIEKELLNKKSKSWAVVCCGLRGQRNLEAIRKEAYQIFLLLKKYTMFDVKLISIEPDQKEIETDTDIVYLPENSVKDYFSKNKIETIVALEATVAIAFAARGTFLKYNMIIRLSGQNPLQGISKEAVDNLLHLNDIGVQHYMVQSSYAKRIMDNAGFKNVTISYPIIEKKECKSIKQEKNVKKAIVGFASSPMQSSQIASRGIHLLTELVEIAKDCTFIVLWRDEAVEIPDGLKAAPNCKIEYGFYDMDTFFGEINCLLIPYADYDNNHACSVSALEAMLRGIPVVCTYRAGIADIVNKFAMGVVCEPTKEALNHAIQYACTHEKELILDSKIELLKKELDSEALIDYMLQISIRFVPDQIITLGEWDKGLRENGQYLVKGHDEIKKYYSQFEIAENYNFDRFVQYPLNCIDFLERKSIDAILNDKYCGRDIRILDIAPGDGRIVQENIKFGYCLAADSSEAMIGVLKKRFPDRKNLETIHVDYLEEQLEGSFDVITTFRYIRHFEYATRKKLYAKIRDNLKQDGILIFDVPNIRLETKLREITGWTNYNIYDMFWTKEDMIKELDENGFRVAYIIAVGNGLMEELPETHRNEPVTWTFGAIRK